MLFSLVASAFNWVKTCAGIPERSKGRLTTDCCLPMKYARRRDVEKRALVRALRLMFEEGVLLRGNRTVFFDQAFTP